MKKFVFVALAAVFMLCSGFVSNEVIPADELYQCNYSITRTTFGDTLEVIKETRHFSYTVESEYHCNGIARSHVLNLVMGNTSW